MIICHKLPHNELNVLNFACCNGCEEKKITNLGTIQYYVILLDVCIFEWTYFKSYYLVINFYRSFSSYSGQTILLDSIFQTRAVQAMHTKFNLVVLVISRDQLEPVCCKKQQKKRPWPVTGLQNRGPLKDLNDSNLIVYESKWFPWSSRINFIPFRIFRGPLFHKPVTGQTLFFCCFLQQTGSRNSRYCQNHQNGVTSCFPKIVF